MKRAALYSLAILVLSIVMVGCRDNTSPTQPQPSSDGEWLAGKADPGIEASKKGRMRTYMVTIANVTAGQPFSPPAAATHKKGFRMFRVGKKASPELELIAEDGKQGPMVTLFMNSKKVTNVVDVGVPLLPAVTSNVTFSSVVSFEIMARRGDRLSIATMLICTNDGFTGLDAVKLPKKGSVVYWLQAYDGGTEDNTEMGTDIVDACSGLGPTGLPGDPNGNENDAVATSPQKKITMHPGIHGGGDLTVSDHGWSGAVAKVTVTRL